MTSSSFDVDNVVNVMTVSYHHTITGNWLPFINSKNNMNSSYLPEILLF